jgi:heme A synthase
MDPAIPLNGPSETDDDSTYLHRQVIGALGALLPLLVYWIAGCRHANDQTEPWRLLPSISSYYHTSAVVAFVSILSALSIFLLMYQGFRNQDGLKDRLIAILAGVAAAGVAFFPTALSNGPGWLHPWVSTTHYVSAAILFACFAVFSLLLFTKHDRRKGLTGWKRFRNVLYVTCGIVIVLCVIWIASVCWRNWSDHGERPIFWPEAIALWAFAASWLIKGRADHTVGRLVEYAKHPERIPRDLRRSARKQKGELPAPEAPEDPRL